jgi:hypothetical protein
MDPDNLVARAVQRASEAAAQSGEVTFDQLNELLPAAQFTPEQIEQVVNGLAEKGIRLIES